MAQFQPIPRMVLTRSKDQAMRRVRESRGYGSCGDFWDFCWGEVVDPLVGLVLGLMLGLAMT